MVAYISTSQADPFQLFFAHKNGNRTLLEIVWHNHHCQSENIVLVNIMLINIPLVTFTAVLLFDLQG